MLGEIINPYGNPDEQTRKKDNATVAEVLEYFDEKQKLFSDKPIPARDILVQRLEALSSGEEIEVVCFNCIDFNYKARGGNYPEAVALDDTESALVECYREELNETVAQLERLGNPKVTIVVPDSELTDTNVFNFGQKEKDRKEIGEKLQQGLSEKFAGGNVSVMLWSDFLANRGLPPAEEYTRNNLPLVMGKYRKTVKDMVASSQSYFVGKGLSEDAIGKVAPAEIAIRSAWYLAMYAGEGNAMADLGNAIMLNFENDGKVLSWSQRGAQGYRTNAEVLPIVTPADTRKFKSWKDGLRGKRGVVFDRTIRPSIYS